MPKNALEQFMTPEWAAELVVERFYPNLTPDHYILEPSCGRGAFLKAFPSFVPVLGIEIDAQLAIQAKRNSGREVWSTDFLSLPFEEHEFTHVIGNPPWRVQTVRSFLEKAWRIMPADGQVGFILPADIFQHGHTVLELERKWSMVPNMIPRDLWGRALRRPIVFAQFFKDRGVRTVGFALYNECESVKRMSKEVQMVLIDGQPRKTTWQTLTEFVLRKLGGRGHLQDIYREVEPIRHTDNRWWKEKVRQVLQNGPFRREEGLWTLA